ncbi:hypothetical protein BKA64DRAFT_771575 [Cadophora sp. MPI-SDFR-AT-0126]|nr:hypothetical protein BKA64DRAFT_771575 [Leotiomycetes sp. MPI-SDFR-AT-0126]
MALWQGNYSENQLPFALGFGMPMPLMEVVGDLHQVARFVNKKISPHCSRLLIVPIVRAVMTTPVMQAGVSEAATSPISTTASSSTSVGGSLSDLEKGETTVSISDEPRSAAAWWQSIRKTATSWMQQPLRLYEIHNQKIEEERQRLQFLYKDIQSGSPAIESYAPGWPRYAAFLNSQHNFPAFRIFGQMRLEVLIDRQAELQSLEKKLFEQNHSDAVSGSGHEWRLQMSESGFENSTDATRRELLNTIEQKFLVYVLQKDHYSVFNWLVQERPVAPGQFDWMYYPTDTIPLSRVDPVEHSILASFLRSLFRSKDKEKDSIIKQYSLASVTIAAKLCSVLLAVSILIIPVFILMWGPNTKASVSVTVIVSVLIFAALMTLFTKATVQVVLMGTAAYCAVLATFLGNIHDRPATATG